jgi:hypothetical protein
MTRVPSRPVTAIDGSYTAQGARADRQTGGVCLGGSPQSRASMRRAAAQERSVFVPRKTRMRNDEWAGLLASGSAYLPHLPASQLRGSGYSRRSSPVTAAGPQRICTVFPILHPRRQVQGDTHVGGHPTARGTLVNSPKRGLRFAIGQWIEDFSDPRAARRNRSLIARPSPASTKGRAIIRSRP